MGIVRINGRGLVANGSVITDNGDGCITDGSGLITDGGYAIIDVGIGGIDRGRRCAGSVRRYSSCIDWSRACRCWIFIRCSIRRWIDLIMNNSANFFDNILSVLPIGKSDNVSGWVNKRIRDRFARVILAWGGFFFRNW